MQKETSAKLPRDKQTPGSSLWRNRDFNIFWFGQTLSAAGDAFALIALPLLVWQATGSVAQMGLVTGVFGISQLVMGIFAGPLVDRLNRRRLMIFCDVLRAFLYFSLPLSWWWFGPQVWLIFLVMGLVACLGMTFQVTYVTAIANLVDGDQITEANGRMQASSAVTYIVGPSLAGIVSASLGPALAIGIDALSFAFSALSLCLIRLRSGAQVASALLKDRSPEQAALSQRQTEQQRHLKQDFLAGVYFLWKEPTLRAVTILLSFFTLLTAGAIDIFIFHLKHDLRQADTAVGIVFGLASVGAVLAGLLAAYLRKRYGFAVCWLGGFLVSSLALMLFGLSSNLLLIAILATCFTFGITLSNISSMSLRQEITPDHLLGRVTSAFWTIHSAPGPLGAALFTAVTQRIGTHSVSLLIGGLCLLVTASGFLTPLRLFHTKGRRGE